MAKKKAATARRPAKKATKKKTAAPKAEQPDESAVPTGLRVRNVEIRRVRVGDIQENPKNYRTHDDMQRDSFAATVEEIGFYGYPDVFEPEPGAVMLVDGELRKQHLVSAYGADAFIDVNVTDFDPVEADKALATKDPLAAMAGLNETKRKELLEELAAAEASPDFRELIGELAKRESIALDAFDDGNEEGDADADAQLGESERLREQWGTEVGQLWVIEGPSGTVHRLLCGDSEREEDVSRLLGGETPEMMVTDPPYGVNYSPEWRREYDPRWDYREGVVENDDRASWRDAYALFPGDVAYVWHAGINAGIVADDLIELGFQIRSQIIWKKQSLVFGRGAYHWHHEPCWYAVREGKTALWTGDRTQSTIWEIPNVHRTQGTSDDQITDHGTQKPLECMARMIRNHGDASMIYDPFLGSGTTMVACENLRRRCFGMELNPAYAAVIIQRLTDIGCEARLVEDEPTN